MTDAEAADVATMQAAIAAGQPGDVAQAPLPAMPQAPPGPKPIEPPPVVTGVSVPSAEEPVTPADIALMQQTVGIAPPAQGETTKVPPPSPMVDVTQKLPPFEPRLPGVSGTDVIQPPSPVPGLQAPGVPAEAVPRINLAGATKPGPMTYFNDINTMDDYITNDVTSHRMRYESLQNLRELSQAYARGEVNLSPDDVHDMAQTLAASNPSSWHTLNQAGSAILDLFGINPADYSGGVASKVGAALLQYPRTYWALTKAELGALGQAAGAVKTAGQAAWEYPSTVWQGQPFAAPKASLVGAGKGVAETLPMLGDLSSLIEGLTGEDRTNTIEQTLRVRNRIAGAEGRGEHWIGYDPKAAPATQAVGEFVGGSLPFAVAPELPGLRALGEFGGAAGRALVEPVVTRAEPLAAAALAKTVPPAVSLAKGLPAAAAEAGAGFAAHTAATQLGLSHSVASGIGAALGVEALTGGGTIRNVIRAVKAGIKTAAPEAVDKIGPYLLQATKQGRPLAREMQLGLEDEIARLGRQQSLIRQGADDLAKTDARMADGTPVFRADEMKKSAAAVRDEISAQQDKARRLGNWAKFEKLFTDTVTTGAAAVGRATPTGIVLGGVNALEAPPDQQRQAFHEGFQTGVALDLPIAVGSVSRAARMDAVRQLSERARDTMTRLVRPGDPDYAHNLAQRLTMAQTPEGRIKLDAMDQFGGLASPMNVPIVALHPDEMLARTPGAPEPAPAGAPAAPVTAMPARQAPNAFYDSGTKRIYYNSAAPLDSMGHELSEALLQAVGDNIVGDRIRDGLTDPANYRAVQNFLDTYRSLLQRANPNFAGLTPEDAVRETFAELGRDVLRQTPPAALYGGRSGGQIIAAIGRRMVDGIFGRPEGAKVVPGALGALEFPGTRDPLRDMLFDLGERAKYRTPYGEPVRPRPPAGGGPPGVVAPPPPGPQPPPPGLTPEEHDLLQRVHGATKKLGLGTNEGHVASAIAAAKAAGVEINDSNIMNMVINAANGRDIFHNIPMPKAPQPPGAPGAVEHPDYADILAKASDAERAKGSKAKDAEANIWRAGIEAAAKAHAQAVGADSDLLTWRTNKYGKSTISGTRFDPADPFHQLILDRANLSPEATQNLNNIEANLGRAVAIDYSHAPGEAEAVTKQERQAARAAATAPERAAGEAAREKLTKSYVPTSITYSPQSNIFIIDGFSPDKFLSNANIVMDFAKDKGIKTYDGINDPLLIEHVQQLTENHQNGYTGSGKPIQGTELTPVEQTPGYKPHIIPKNYLDQINAMMGNTGARTPERVLKGVEGAKISPQVAEKQLLAQKNSPYYDPLVGETNKLRSMMPPEMAKKIEPVYERLRPELIDRVRREPVSDEQVLRPSGFTGDRAQLGLRGLPGQEFIAGGFMPPTSFSTEPRAIKEAAVRTDEGEVFTGKYHATAQRKLWDKYPVGSVPHYEQGWITNNGEYLNRKDAHLRAIEMGQVPLRASEIAEHGLGLESERFYGEGRYGAQSYMPPTLGFEPGFRQPEPASDETIRAALQSNKAPLVGSHRNLPPGTPISVRIDIPSFLRSGIYAQTVHQPKIGKALGYDSIVHLDKPVSFTVRESTALKIRNKEINKAPIAAVEGRYNPNRTLPPDINDLSKWTPLGFDPMEHSYFYDKTATERPVIGGDEAIHIGNTVYVKNPVYGKQSDFTYMPPTAEAAPGGGAEWKRSTSDDKWILKNVLSRQDLYNLVRDKFGQEHPEISTDDVAHMLQKHHPQIIEDAIDEFRHANEDEIRQAGREDYSEEYWREQAPLQIAENIAHDIETRKKEGTWMAAPEQLHQMAIESAEKEVERIKALPFKYPVPGPGAHEVEVSNYNLFRRMRDNQIARAQAKVDELKARGPQTFMPPTPTLVQSKQDKASGYVPVTVDITKLDAAHASAHPEAHVGPGGEGGIKGRYPRFEQFLKSGQPIEMPTAGLDSNGDPQFENGRHRFAVLRDQGVKTTEVSVPKDQADEFRSLFAPDPPPGARQTYMPPTSPAFHQWFGDSKAVDEEGKPLTLFHGSTHDFTEFDPSIANPENDWGKGIYLTNSPKDVSVNYAGEGPDLTNRIENETQRVLDETRGSQQHPWGSPEQKDEWDIAEAQARKNLGIEHGGAVYPVFAKMENPLELGGKNDPYWTLDYDEDTGHESGDLVALHNALMSAAAPYHGADAQRAFTDAMEKVGYDGKASDYVKALRDSEGLAYATDEHGNIAGKEIIRDALERMGFDGIIDHEVHEKFPRMEGMGPDTAHYIAFEPTQVKSAIGNRGTFNPAMADITYMPPTAHEALSDPTKELDLSKDENFHAVNNIVPVKGSPDLHTYVDTDGRRFVGKFDPSIQVWPTLEDTSGIEGYTFMPPTSPTEGERVKNLTELMKLKEEEPMRGEFYTRKKYYVPGELAQKEGDPKTIKGQAYGVQTYVMYTGASDSSGVMNACAHATRGPGGCIQLCLVHNGKGGMTEVELARINKTKFFYFDQPGFLDKLDKEITRNKAKVRAKGLEYAIRLNGTSDIKWEDYGIMEKHPDVTFYDYTKYPEDQRNIPENYDLTYSYTGDPASIKRSNDWAKNKGMNTAVVFEGGMPAEFLGRPVVDGDVSDLRYKDPKGVIVGLHAKGNKALAMAREGTTGFIYKTPPEDVAIPYIWPQTKAKWLKDPKKGEAYIDNIKDGNDPRYPVPKVNDLVWKHGDPFKGLNPGKVAPDPKNPGVGVMTPEMQRQYDVAQKAKEQIKMKEFREMLESKKPRLELVPGVMSYHQPEGQPPIRTGEHFKKGGVIRGLNFPPNRSKKPMKGIK